MLWNLPHKPPILALDVIFVTYWCSFMTMPWCKSNKKLEFNSPIQNCWAFFVFNNKHWFMCAMLFCFNWKDDKYYPINKIHNNKKLLILYLYVEIRGKPYQCNTCSNDESSRFNKSVSIIMNFNSMEIYINTFKKDKINDSFKIIYIFLEKHFALKNSLYWKKFWTKKITWIEKLLTLKKILNKKNYLNWKIVNIEKTLN